MAPLEITMAAGQSGSTSWFPGGSQMLVSRLMQGPEDHINVSNIPDRSDVADPG